MLNRLRLRIVDWLWPSNMMQTVGSCANRRWHRGVSGPIEITVIYRDMRQHDGYSREELVEMLATVRKCEAEMEWRVPDPLGPTTAYPTYVQQQRARRDGGLS